MPVPLPDWLRTAETYAPPKDRDAFLRRTAAAIITVLAKMRRQPEPAGPFALIPPLRLAFVFVVVLLVAASRNFFFVELIGAGLLVRLALLSGPQIARVLTAPFQAFVLSLIVLAPAAFLGQPRALVVVSLKTLVSTTAISLVAASTRWNKLTCAFKTFGAPDLLVFTLDLALKYVAVLSEIALATLDAVRKRAVGRNRRKGATTGGIVGVAFVRAQELAAEQFDAMTCRCFSGEYRRFRAARFRAVDWAGLAVLVGIVVLFVFLQKAVL